MSTDQLSHQPPLVYEANPAQYKLVKFIGKKTLTNTRYQTPGSMY